MYVLFQVADIVFVTVYLRIDIIMFHVFCETISVPRVDVYIVRAMCSTDWDKPAAVLLKVDDRMLNINISSVSFPCLWKVSFALLVNQ